MKSLLIAIGCGTVAGVGALVTLYALRWVGQLGAQIMMMNSAFVGTLLLTGIAAALMTVVARRVFRGAEEKTVRSLEARVARLESQSPSRPTD